MDSIHYGYSPSTTLREHNDMQVPTGRTIDRYHYRAALSTEPTTSQQSNRHFLLENVPALLQAVAFQ
jgi:hypothetical protein